MDILLYLFLGYVGSAIYVILNAIFGFSNDNYIVYYDHRIEYQDPPF